jgi:hypothetical protein
MQKITLIQQDGRGRSKIEGIRQFGGDRFEIEVVNIDSPIEPVIDDTSVYLPENIRADLILDFLKHPDLSEDLSILAQQLNIPVVASGKKISRGSAICPPT